MAQDTGTAQAEDTRQRELAGKYLTFRLGAEEFGVEILKVREIIGLMGITVVPRMPESVRGVINLRGKIIAVIDLRRKFSMPTTEDTEITCIIVVDITIEDQHTHMGILVDAVSEVLDIKGAHIEPTPSFGTGVNTDFILGMARIEERVKILLNIEQVLETSQVLSLGEGTGEAALEASQAPAA